MLANQTLSACTLTHCCIGTNTVWSYTHSERWWINYLPPEDATDMSSDSIALAEVQGDKSGGLPGVLGDKSGGLPGVLGDKSGGLPGVLDENVAGPLSSVDCAPVGLEAGFLFTYTHKSIISYT